MSRFRRAGLPVAIIACIVLAAITVLGGCGGESTEAKQEQYREEWQDAMQAFQDQVDRDDEKVKKLVEEQDVAGVIRFISDRIQNIKETETEILDLYPPDDLRLLHATTLYYLETLIAQFEAQTELYEAALEGEPTTDLTAKVESLVNKNRQLNNELSIEVQKRDLNITTQPQDETEGQVEEEQVTPEEQVLPQDEGPQNPR